MMGMRRSANHRVIRNISFDPEVVEFLDAVLVPQSGQDRSWVLNHLVLEIKRLRELNGSPICEFDPAKIVRDLISPSSS